MDSEAIFSVPQPRRIIARALAWGVGFGLGLGLALGAFYYYTIRPKGWDTLAVRAESTMAKGIGRVGKLTNGTLAVNAIGTSFEVDLKNTTRADISLPTNLRIMEKNKGTGALRESSLKLSEDYFLPAGHTVSVSIENAALCTEDTKTDKCFDANFKDQSEIVIFDESSKLEIRVPIPPFTPDKDGVPRTMKFEQDN